jgi:hypothetical protein
MRNLSCKREIHADDRRTQMKRKYTVTFKVIASEYNRDSINDYEFYLKDLLNKAVLPALNLELVPLTFEVKKARN